MLTAGGDQIFPRGLPVGVVDKVLNDPDRDGFVEVVVKPAAHLDQLDEVLVVTSTEPRFPPDQQQDIATSEALKGADAEQQKTSEGMAEKLPGLDRAQHTTRSATIEGHVKSDPGDAAPGCTSSRSLYAGEWHGAECACCSGDRRASD